MDAVSSKVTINKTVKTHEQTFLKKWDKKAKLPKIIIMFFMNHV